VCWVQEGWKFILSCLYVLESVVSVTETSKAGPLVEYERRIANGELVEGDACQVECLHFIFNVPNFIDEMDFPACFIGKMLLDITMWIIIVALNPLLSQLFFFSFV